MSNWQNLATTDTDTVRQWFGCGTRAGIGVATGTASGVIVVDVDLKEAKNGKAGLAFLEARFGLLPETLTATTPSGGRHLVLKYPVIVDTRIKNKVGLGTALFGWPTDVDIRADEGQINVAPTCRDGACYEWVTSFEDTELAELPEAWPDLILGVQRATPLQLGPPVGIVKEGSRNDILFHVTRSGERASGADDDRLVELAHEWNQQNCDPPLSAQEAEAAARSASRILRTR